WGCHSRPASFAALTCAQQLESYPVCLFFFLLIHRPPRSTLFPTRRSSDLRPRRSAGARRGPLRVARVPQRAAARWRSPGAAARRSEEHTSELQSLTNLVCRLLLEKKNRQIMTLNRNKLMMTYKNSPIDCTS